jgi:hypothetical protein
MRTAVTCLDSSGYGDGFETVAFGFMSDVGNVGSAS